jgi:phage terminase large subunit-like protein
VSRRLPAPRWQTPLPSSVVGSWGPDVIAWAQAELGIRYDRWQRRALNRALAFDRTGRLVHDLYLISTGRQNGKTAIVRGITGWALTAPAIPDWHRILGLAHDRGQARIPYEAVLADLQPIRRRYPRGGLALTRYLGIRSDLYGVHREYHTGSRESRNAIRGTTNDLGIFDEVRTQTNYETWAALEPTTTAMPDPLVIGLSTAGDDRSVLLRDWWERGRRIIDGAEPFAGFGMTWYAADDDDHPEDPAAWRKANPSLAEGRIPQSAILSSLYTLSPQSFRSERLNLWATGGDEWLPPGTWRARNADQPTAGIRVVLGAEAVPTWRRVTVTIAIVTDAGAWIGVAGELDSGRTGGSSIAPAELVRLVGRLAGEWHATELAFSAAAAAAPHLTEWCEVAKVRAVPLGPRQIRAASSLFRSELIGGRLTHGDDPLLAQQVRIARPSSSLEGGDWYFSIRDSDGEIDALRAAAWAAWAAIAPEERAPVPGLHI